MSTKDTMSDIEKMEKYINISLAGNENPAEYLLENYLPESKFVKNFKSIPMFRNISERHFSVLLRQILRVDNKDRYKLITPKYEVVNHMATEGSLQGFTLKQLINQNPTILSLLSYSQATTNFKKLLNPPNGSVSRFDMMFYQGEIL
jgi:hypothetical protein